MKNAHWQGSYSTCMVIMGESQPWTLKKVNKKLSKNGLSYTQW